MQRRWFLNICLALLLVLTQQGGLLHALSHPLTGSESQRHVHVPSHAEPCDLCAAFAAHGNGLPTPDLALPGRTDWVRYNAPDFTSSTLTPHPAYHPRAPPGGSLSA